MVQRSTA